MALLVDDDEDDDEEVDEVARSLRGIAPNEGFVSGSVVVGHDSALPSVYVSLLFDGMLEEEEEEEEEDVSVGGATSPGLKIPPLTKVFDLSEEPVSEPLKVAMYDSYTCAVAASSSFCFSFSRCWRIWNSFLYMILSFLFSLFFFSFLFFLVFEFEFEFEIPLY